MKLAVQKMYSVAVLTNKYEIESSLKLVKTFTRYIIKTCRNILQNFVCLLQKKEHVKKM